MNEVIRKRRPEQSDWQKSGQAAGVGSRSVSKRVDTVKECLLFCTFWVQRVFWFIAWETYWSAHMIKTASTGQQMAWSSCQETRHVAAISDAAEGRAKGLLESSDGLPSQFTGLALYIAQILLDFSAGRSAGIIRSGGFWVCCHDKLEVMISSVLWCSITVWCKWHGPFNNKMLKFAKEKLKRVDYIYNNVTSTPVNFDMFSCVGLRLLELTCQYPWLVFSGSFPSLEGGLSLLVCFW